jgi:arylsulfatase A-like enzyme
MYRDDTPNIDRLASGRWNPHARLRSGRFVRALPLEEFTLAEALREAGYRTAGIGKRHPGSEPFSLPEYHGSDVNVAGNAHGAPGNYFFPYQGDWKIPTTALRAKWNVLHDGEPGEYLTDRLTDEAVRLVRRIRLALCLLFRGKPNSYDFSIHPFVSAQLDRADGSQ